MWPFSSRSKTTDTEMSTPSLRSDGGHDPALTQKKRARRRLIGAIALALAAIIVVPMVFDSEPQPVTEDIVIKIPAQNTPFKPPAPAPETVAPETPVEPVPEAKPQAEAEASANSVKSEKTTEKSPEKTDKGADTKRAQAALEGKELPAKAEGDGKFVVQLGAFSSAEKVKQLQDKLSSAGIKSFTQKVQTARGETTRLRVGPFVEKAEAERMQQKVKAAGLDSKILPLK